MYAVIPALAVAEVYGAVDTVMHHSNAPHLFHRTVGDAVARCHRKGGAYLVHDHLHGARSRCNGRRCQLVFRTAEGVIA